MKIPLEYLTKDPTSNRYEKLSSIVRLSIRLKWFWILKVIHSSKGTNCLDKSLEQIADATESLECEIFSIESFE